MKKTKRIRNRICAILLSVLMGFMGIIPSMPVMVTNATGLEPIVIGVGGAVLGGALAGVAEGITSSLASKAVDYFVNPTETKTNSNGVNTYIYRGGNTTTSNTTNNYKVFKDYTTVNNNTTNYRYDFYNPVTNTYNTTNTFKYYETNNTFNYTTYNTTNNYTTNYYIQDNSTHINYYIVEEDTSTGEIFETYYEIYFELPDGRNSYDLKREDIWGTYFIYDYSKYESVAEDDGTTLGLWHLDGNTKDSSYWGNSAGSSYTLEFKDAKHDGGKYFSSSLDDYLELSLDKVSLPDSYTLEWIQYASDNDYSEYGTFATPECFPISDKNSNSAYLFQSLTHKTLYDQPHYACCAKFIRYLDTKFVKNSGIFISGNDGSFDIPRDSFVNCALVCNNGIYSLYRNGSKVMESSDISNSGILISDSAIKFYCDRKMVSNTDYVEKIVDTDRGYFLRKSDKVYTFGEKKVICNSDFQCVMNFSEYDQFSSCWNTVNNITSTPISTEYCCASIDRYISSRQSYYYDINCDTLIDEVRLSKGVLYTGNYTPSSQPFTTNTVLAVPENPSENEVAFKTNYNIGNVRFGGARPTYPATGDIFVAMTGQKVESIQQYQETGWYEVQASIYNDGEWKNLKNFDMSVTTVTDPENPDPDNPDKPDPDNPDPDNPDPDNPDPDNPDNPDDPDDKESIWDKLGKVISGLMSIIGKLLSPLIDGIISLIGMIVNALESLSGLSNTFGSFLKDTFVFIPEDIMSIIGLGVMLTIFASIIKIFM